MLRFRNFTADAAKKKTAHIAFFWNCTSRGLRNELVRAGTGDSVGRFHRYWCSTLLHYNCNLVQLLLSSSVFLFNSIPEPRMYLDHEGNCKGDISPSWDCVALSHKNCSLFQIIADYYLRAHRASSKTTTKYKKQHQSNRPQKRSIIWIWVQFLWAFLPEPWICLPETEYASQTMDVIAGGRVRVKQLNMIPRGRLCFPEPWIFDLRNYKRQKSASKSHKSTSRRQNLNPRALNLPPRALNLPPRAMNLPPRARTGLPEPWIWFPEAESAFHSLEFGMKKLGRFRHFLNLIDIWEV